MLKLFQVKKDAEVLMKNRAILLSCAAFILMGLSVPDAKAQSDDHTVEVGVQVVWFRTDLTRLTEPEFPPLNYGPPATEMAVGAGGRVTIDITDHVAVEAEANAFPDTESGLSYQVLAGVKAGVRGERFGVFGKARPGFVHFLRFLDRPTGFAGPDDFDGRNQFAFDVGGVLEAYPTRRITVRLDVGDTIIRVSEQRAGIPGSDLPARTAHNFQASLGVGYRF